MIDEDIPCEDILIQVNTTKSTLHKGTGNIGRAFESLCS